MGALERERMGAGRPECQGAKFLRILISLFDFQTLLFVNTKVHRPSLPFPLKARQQEGS